MIRLNKTNSALLTLALVVFSSTAGSRCAGQPFDTTFTYQGELKENGSLAAGSFNMDFSLWDAASGGNQIGATQSLSNVVVTNGRFSVELDFGATAFDDTDRWLEIAVDGFTLSPRHPITRSPFSIQTRGIVVDANKNVGIGTAAPNFPLHVESNLESPIHGLYTGGAGSRYGVYGRTDSTASTRGVFGYAAASGGFTTGVQGRSNSTTGTGVAGFAAATSGLNYGVLGETNSPDGYAGYFIGRAHVSDTLFVGRENAITGSEYFGVEAPVNSGFGGMYVSTTGQEARPFYGYAAGGDFDAYHYFDGLTGNWYLYNSGVHVTVTDIGEVGIGPNPPLLAIGPGVFVDGMITASANGTAIAASTDGTLTVSGVSGHATAATGMTNGVKGTSDSLIGTGVFGRASSSSGVNYGVRGASDSAAGYDFYADGAGINYGSSSSIRWKNNVEAIEDPLEKVATMRGVSFDWNAEHGGHRDVGMIAEEVGAVLPEIVNYEPNGVDAQGMDYSKLTPLLVEAVKALRAEKDVEIKSIRDQNSELTARIAELEALVKQLSDARGKETQR